MIRRTDPRSWPPPSSTRSETVATRSTPAGWGRRADLRAPAAQPPGTVRAGVGAAADRPGVRPGLRPRRPSVANARPPRFLTGQPDDRTRDDRAASHDDVHARWR